MPFSRTVLLIDARSKDRAIYRSYLAQDDRYRYRFLEVGSITEGLALCQNNKPDLVLLDFDMPDGDGLAFLNQWRLQFGRDPAPIIMLTSQSSDRIAVQAMKSGAQDYLIKSTLSPQELCRCAHQVMERIGLLQDLQQQQAQQQLLGNIALRIRQAIHLRDILDMVLPEVRSYLKVDRLLVYQFHSQGKGEVVAESVVPGYRRSIAQQIEEPCFQGPLGANYQRGNLGIIPDVHQADLHPCHLNLLDQFQVQAYVVAPIVVSQDDEPLPTAGHLWGLLIAHQCSAPRAWSKWDTQLLEQLATHLAIAIRQAELLQTLRDLNTHLEDTVRERTAQLQESNRQLSQTNADLARATRLKNEFLANMSHELRTPLNAILGMTAGLQDAVFGELGERQGQAVSTIAENSQHLLGLINDILDLAQIEADKLELCLQPLSVSQLCRSSLAAVRQAALHKQIHLKLSLQGTFPALIADEQRMHQVLTNLLSNAIKFTPEGGTVTLSVCRELEKASSPLPETPSVILTTPTADPIALTSPGPATDSATATMSPPASLPWICFSVTDTGIGIAPENLSKLFQSFMQIDSRLNRQYGGAGLGLALVRRIVELHGGSVEVTSSPGQGSCFTVRLPDMEQPYGVSDGSPDRGSAAPETIGSTLSSFDPFAPMPEPALILIAEDDQANVDTISSYLESRGYRLLLTNQGQTALSLAQSHHPHLILMDLHLPDMEGAAVIEHIRQIPAIAEVPIIVLSDCELSREQEHCLTQASAGAHEYFTKPVRLKQLAITIQKLLSAKG